MKILSVAGARPNFVKVAPIARALAAAARRGGPARRIESLVVDTGQHYDEALAAGFIRDLAMPPPARTLRVGSGSHAAQTAAVLCAFEAVLLEERPDIVIVVGDVNSTLACALAAAKLGIRVAHVEAGLRSFDRRMPEEINRRLTDALADLLFTSEDDATQNLRREGIADERVFFVGNVMVDSLRWAQQLAPPSTVLARLGLAERTNGNGFALVTLHRPSNVDSPDRLAALVEAFGELADELPIVFPAHPRTRDRLEKFGLTAGPRLRIAAPGRGPQRGCVWVVDPLPYLDCLQMLGAARLVLTDSGGIQEETTCLGVPCITVRETTERPITVRAGTNVVAGTDPATILSHARNALANGRSTATLPPLWDGHAAERIVEILLDRCGEAKS